MGKKIRKIGRHLWKHKAPWSIVFLILIIGFIDTNSCWNRRETRQDNARLREEIKKYELQCSKDSAKLEQLKSCPEAVIKVARETHLMKADDEDVYIVTTAPNNE